MGTDHGLTVRQFVRHDVGLDAVITLVPPTTAVLRFSAAAQSALCDGGVRATLLDVGDGGLGVRTPLFLPRGATVRVSVFSPDTAPGSPPLLEAEARVQRVTMCGREPIYQLGMAFTTRTPDLVAQISRIRALSPATQQEGARESA